MKRSERLDIVQQAAARTERGHAERVAGAERHLTEMQDKLAALERYRTEYETGFATRAGAGLGAVGVRDYQTFMARLGEALVQQGELVNLARAALEAGRTQWREAAQRSHVVDTLAERWQGEELRAADRRDQLENDELSQQRAVVRENSK
jgi:flagellar FliJ protein